MNMTLFMELTLLSASIGLGCFCVVLARRLRHLNNLETGLGGAIAVMAAEVDRLERAIKNAREEATSASNALSSKIEIARAERAKWELRQKIEAVAMQLPYEDTPSSRLRRKRKEFSDV